MKKVLGTNPTVHSDSLNSDLLLIDKGKIHKKRSSDIVID